MKGLVFTFLLNTQEAIQIIKANYRQLSTHCIFHLMGRENQEGNEPCFSDTFNTFWETQTT